MELWKRGDKSPNTRSRKNKQKLPLVRSQLPEKKPPPLTEQTSIAENPPGKKHCEFSPQLHKPTRGSRAQSNSAMQLCPKAWACLIEILQFPQRESAKPGAIPPGTTQIPARRQDHAVCSPGGADQLSLTEIEQRAFQTEQLKIRSWSWNCRGRWHQTRPPTGTHQHVWS